MKKSIPLGFVPIPILVVIGLVISCLPGSAYAAEPKQNQEAGAVMGMHYVRTVVNHGLEMVIGANVVMLAQMKMSPGLDQKAISHGRSTMERGKKAIQQILTDPVLQALQKGSGRDAPIMKYAQDLAEAMLEVADTLEQIKLSKINPDTTTLHYFNILIIQALEAAAGGSNLIIAGQTGMSPGIDMKSVEQGKTMLTDARSLIIEVMGSGAMAKMHSREAGKMPEMGSTHELAMVVLNVLDLLDSLP
jgi:hypothetical protein